MQFIGFKRSWPLLVCYLIPKLRIPEILLAIVLDSSQKNNQETKFRVNTSGDGMIWSGRWTQDSKRWAWAGNNIWRFSWYFNGGVGQEGIEHKGTTHFGSSSYLLIYQLFLETTCEIFFSGCMKSSKDLP